MIQRPLHLDRYSTLVFDCDGVLLNSNEVKTQAFFQAALPYGEPAAQALADYHVANGGISRYKKFSHFLEHIVPAPLENVTLDHLLARYADFVLEGLLNCEVAPGLHKLREKTAGIRWMIVSGGDQSELRSIFAKRQLASMFDGGIFGSPDNKDDILAREKANGNVVSPSLFIGDSKYDHQASTAAGLDFLFLSAWSEVKDWEYWCQQNEITFLSDIASLDDALK